MRRSSSVRIDKISEEMAKRWHNTITSCAVGLHVVPVFLLAVAGAVVVAVLEQAHPWIIFNAAREPRRPLQQVIVFRNASNSTSSSSLCLLLNGGTEEDEEEIISPP